MGFASPESGAQAEGSTGFLGIGQTPENDLDDLAELFRGMRILEEGFCLTINFGGLSDNQVSKIRGEYRVIEIAFQDFFAGFAAGQYAHGHLLELIGQTI